MTVFTTPDALMALLQVVLIDLVRAGDNAIVIGLAAAGAASTRSLGSWLRPRFGSH